METTAYEESKLTRAIVEAVRKKNWTEACQLIPRINSTKIFRLRAHEYLHWPFQDSMNDESAVLRDLCSRGLWEPIGEMLGQGLPPEQQSFVIQQAVNRADCATFIRFIFPHCPGEERIRVLAESLNRMSETEFQRYVSLPELSDGDLSNFMFGDSPSTLSNQMSESETLEHQLHASEPFDEVMSDFMLGDSPSTLSNRASETELDLHVLAEISDDEISKVMDYSVRRGMWKAVGVLLNKGVPDEQRLWAVGEARRRADEHEYFRYVSAHCDGDLDTELTQLVTLGYWKAVGKVLQRAGQTVSGTVSDSKRRWTVDVASTECDERSFVSLILPYCFDDQLESIAKLSVLRGHWEVVGQVLKKGVSDLIRAWIIKEAVIYADAESFVNYILPYCSGVTTVNVARFVAELTGSCKWSALGKLLRSGVSNVQLKWVAREICVKVHNTEENLFELDMRSDKKIAEPLLTEMKNYGDRFLECLAVELLLLHSWSTIDFEVAKFLIQMNINLPLQLCIIEKASTENCHTETFVTSICSPKLKECTLEQLVSRRLFVAAKQVLDSGVSDICRKEAAPMVLTAFMEMILARDIPTEFFDVLLSVCNTEQMSHVVKLTVRNGHWDVLCKLLEIGISEKTRELAMQEVYKYASCEAAAQYLTAFVKKEYLEQILVPLVAHECWYLVDKVLQQSVCETRRRFAIERASILASSADFHEYIFPHLNDNEVEVVLPHLVRRKCWSVVIILLERPLDSAMYKWAVEEANKHASADEYLLCIRQRPGEVDIERALSDLMDKFDENVNQVKGSYVCAYLPLTDLTKLLEFGPSDALRLRFFEWASMCARDSEYATHIIPHFCAHDSLDGVFTNLVKGCKWISAGKMLEQTANEMLCKQAIYQHLCKFRSEGEDFDFAQNILPYIPDSMHEDITSLFMTEKKWFAVIQMLHKGKDGHVYDQAVLACKANCSFFMDYCLPHCTERQLGVVLQEMCQQGKWSDAAHLLSLVALKLDTVRHSLFIQQVFEHKSKEITPFPKWETLFSRCPSETLQLVLPTAINRCMWETVLFILKKGVSLSARDSAISQASHHVSDVQFATDFLPLISKHDPEEVNVKLIEGLIPKLIERRMWRSLGVIFQNDQVKEGSYNLVIQDSWDVVKTQTSTQGREWPHVQIYYNDLDIYICNVMPFCTEHHITRILSDCVMIGMWKVVGKVLQREVDATLKRNCVRQACHIAGEQAIIRHILPYSKDDDIEELVRILALRKFWQAAFKLQQRKIDLPKVTVDVVALCKDAGKCVSVAGVLKLCTDDQVEALVGMFMSEGRWELVGTVLRYVVNDKLHRHIVEQALLQLDRNSVDFLCYILPHSKEELDDTFVHLVESHYASVRKIMQYGVSERKLLWAAKREMTGLTNLPEVFLYLRDEYIELICKDYLHELETGKAGTITPSAVSGVLKYTESDETLGEAIKIAIKSDRGFNEMSNIDMKYHIQKYLQRCSEQYAESILNLLLEKGLLEYATTAKDGYLNETWCRKAIVKAEETEQERILLHLIQYNLTDDKIDNFAKIHIRMLKKSRAFDSSSMKFILRVFDRCTAPTKLLIAETLTILPHGKFNSFTVCYKLEDTDFLRQEYAKIMVSRIRECMSRGEFYELQICTSEDVWNMLNPQEMLQLLKHPRYAQHVVSRCSRARLLELIPKIVLEKRWKVLQQLLFQRGLDEMTTKTIVEKACEQASEDELFKSGHGILCFCADDQVETALRILIDRNMSTAVGYLLQRNAGCVQNIVGLKPVIDNLDNEKYNQLILPFAEALFDCDTLVTDLVSRGLWDRLTPNMMKEVSDDTRESVIEQACELASDEHLQHVLFCTEVDLDQILEKLTEKEMWKSIYHMWVHGRIRGESWFSDLVYIEACKHLDENEVCTCLRSCPDHLVDVVLDVVVSRGLWKAATTVLARHFSEDRRDTEVIEVCRSADQKTVSGLISSFFTGISPAERLDAMLDVLVSRCMWTEAERLAYQGVSAEKRRWAVIKACQSEKDDDAAADFIAHHCDAMILHETLAQLVVADHWKAVAELMDSDLFISMRNRSGVWRMHTEQTEYGSNVEENDENCLNDFTLTWIYRRACKYADEDAFRKMSWQLHSSFEGKYTVFSLFMKHLVRRRLWRAVDVIFQRTMSDVDYLCLQTGKGPYRETAIQFDRGHTSQQSRFTEHLEVFIWAADEAGRLATEEELTKYIIPHCATVQLETILEHLIRRRLWKGIGTILETSKNSKRVNYTNREMTSKIQRVTKSLQIRAVEEASKGAEEEILCILPYCTCSQFDTALGHSTEREHWRAVGKLLQLTHDNPNTEGSGTVEITPNCVMAVQESSMLARDGVFSKHILPFCTGKRLHVLVSCVSPQPADSSPTEESSKDVVFEGIAEPSPLNVPENAPLANLIKRKMWSSLEDLLNLRQQLPEVYRKYILEETSKQLHYTEVLEFNKYILKNCLKSELHFILRPFVNKGMWSVVKEVLQRDLHDSLLRWTLTESSKHADDETFQHSILPHCPAELYDVILPNLLSRGLLGSVSNIYQQGATPAQQEQIIRGSCPHADDSEGRFAQISSLCTDDSSFQTMMVCLYENRQKHATVSLLCTVIRESICKWAMTSQGLYSDNRLWALLKYYHTDTSWAKSLLGVVRIANRRGRVQDLSELHKVVGWSKEVCSLVFTVVLTCICRIISKDLTCHDEVKRMDEVGESTSGHIAGQSPRGDAAHRVFDYWCSWIGQSIQDHEGKSQNISNTFEPSTSDLLTEVRGIVDSLFSLLELFRDGLSVYQGRRTSEEFDMAFVELLTVVPVSDELQDIAIRHMLLFKEDHWSFYSFAYRATDETTIEQRKRMLDQRRWRTMKRATEIPLWEHTRRLLFHAAVREKKWKVVMQWTDYSVCDDQRLWALEEAYKDKQWKVMLLLADHGLTLAERMRVHNRLAKYADWDTARLIFERGADVSEMRDMLQNTRKKTRKHCMHDFDIKKNRDASLLQIEESFDRRRKYGTYQLAAEYKWSYMLYCFHRSGSEGNFMKCLRTAMKRKAWHVVVHLVRDCLNTEENDKLFQDMLTQEQWDVCRVCLETGVSVQVCLDALDQLIEASQWTLVVVIVSSYDLGDDKRQKIMHIAMERREGSVVRRCIQALKTIDDLEKLFEYAFQRDIWQALKPLVEYKDSTGIRHRDMAFLEAIEQHVWDVVDHCQLHHADINMKDKNGETPLHRAARVQDWQAVEAIVSRDGDPNLLDKDGVSVLNQAVGDLRSSSTVEVLIEYLASIHQPAKSSPFSEDISPLERLIERCRGSEIEHSLMWCPDQWKGVTVNGETALHAVCRSGWPNTMYYLIARKVDPLAVTKNGYSVLSYALMNVNDYRKSQKMLGECISLGLGTHQPGVSQAWEERYLQARRMEMFNADIIDILQQFEEQLVSGRNELERLEREDSKRPHYDSNERIHEIEILFEKLDRVLQKVQNELRLLRSKEHPKATDSKKMRSYFIRQFKCFGEVLSSSNNVPYWYPYSLRNMKEMEGRTKSRLGQAYQNAVARVPEDALLHALIEGDLESHFDINTVSLKTIFLTTYHGKITLTKMLYESGALSYTNLQSLHDMLSGFLENVIEFTESERESRIVFYSFYKDTREKVENFLSLLTLVEEMPRTPRTLISLCRLKISHCLDVRGRRERDIEKHLPLPRSIKKYLMFSDLTDPTFGEGVRLPLSEENQEWMECLLEMLKQD